MAELSKEPNVHIEAPIRSKTGGIMDESETVTSDDDSDFESPERQKVSAAIGRGPAQPHVQHPRATSTT